MLAHRVLEGTLAITLEDATQTALEGGTIVIAPGIHHRWWNPTANPVRVLYVCAPGSCEATCHELSLWLAANGD